MAQGRECGMVWFFLHENQLFPPSLSYYMVNCNLEKINNLLTLLPHEESSNPYDVNWQDGAAVVHFLPTVGIAKYDEYAACIFLLHMTKLLNNASHVDIMWDTYIPTTIKAATRKKRGKGARQ